MTLVDLTGLTSLQLDCARRTAPQALMFSGLLRRPRFGLDMRSAEDAVRDSALEWTLWTTVAGPGSPARAPSPQASRRRMTVRCGAGRP